MVNIQSPTAEIRRGKKKKEERRRKKNKPQHKNIMAHLLHRAAIMKCTAMLKQVWSWVWSSYKQYKATQSLIAS